jgi:predicted SnoaL-like aldol condensation-catalyzing enzyme
MRKGMAWVAVAVALGVSSSVTSSAAAQDNDQNQNQAVFALVVNQVFNGGDLALVDDLVATDVTDNGSPLGRDGFKAMVQSLRAKNPGYKLAIDAVSTQGDRVIGRVTETDSAGTDSRLVVLRIADGQVKEYWNLADEPALRQQFGLGAPGARPSTSSN